MGFNTKLLFAFSLVTNKILTSSHYTNYTLEDDKVCSVTNESRELFLGKDNKSAITVRDTHYFKNWSGRRDFECRFIVKTKDRMGLFAVIQKMSLRKDREKDACIDYIQFRAAPKKKFHHILSLLRGEEREQSQWNNKYCGQLQPFESPISDEPPTSQVAVNAYIAKGGEIEVKIYIAAKKLEPGSSIEIEVAFTSYMDCSVAPSTYKSCDEGYCIHKDYFSDNVVNCPFLSCKDEPNCPKFVYDPTEFEKGLDTKVYVTAVSSIFLSFFLFLGCIMLCRYFDMLCWSDPPVQGEHHRAGTELEQVSPSAPPPPESPDKDLPPAYETLFPGR